VWVRRIFRRIREIFESVAYAGLQPGSASQPRPRKWLGPLSGPVERFLSGGPAPSDPLYLTNRSTASKLKGAAIIGIPVLLLAGGLYGVLTNSFDFGAPKPVHEVTAAEAAAKLLPHMDRDIRIETNHDVGVLEVHIEDGSPKTLVGSLKNNTDHEIGMAEAVFDVTDLGGSQLGAVSTRVEHLKARGTSNFRFPIQQRHAVFALVREVHVQ
jgi:hypothetical protein